MHVSVLLYCAWGIRLFPIQSLDSFFSLFRGNDMGELGSRILVDAVTRFPLLKILRLGYAVCPAFGIYEYFECQMRSGSIRIESQFACSNSIHSFPKLMFGFFSDTAIHSSFPSVSFCMLKSDLGLILKFRHT
jgi:hypothetical protein